MLAHYTLEMLVLAKSFLVIWEHLSVVLNVMVGKTRNLPTVPRISC